MAYIKKKSKVRNWCFTEWDLTKYDDWKTLNLQATHIRYIVYQKEQGNKRTTDNEGIHLQGYIEFENAITLQTVKQRLHSDQIHLEPRWDTAKTAREYCLKTVDNCPEKWKSHGCRVPDTKPVELGVPIKQGRRTDVSEMYAMMKAGATDYELQEHNPGLYARMYKALKVMRFNHLGATLPKFKNIDVHVYFGLTRSGKTRKATENKDSFILTCEGSQLWFDGYTNQKTLVIDDFYGQIRFSQLLQLLDGHRKPIQIKGAWTYPQWDEIIITSNVHPERWYNSYSNVPDNARDALYERIKTLTNVIRTNNEKPRGLPKVETIETGHKILLDFVNTEVVGNTRQQQEPPGEYYEYMDYDDSESYSDYIAPRIGAMG